MPELIVGIDLGTTNSEIAYVKDGRAVVITEDGDPILPSFVGLADDGRLLVGKAARNQWVLAPHRTDHSDGQRFWRGRVDADPVLTSVASCTLYVDTKCDVKFINKLGSKTQRAPGEISGRAFCSMRLRITAPAACTNRPALPCRECASAIAATTAARVAGTANPTAATFTVASSAYNSNT